MFNGVLNFGEIIITVSLDNDTGDYVFTFSGPEISEPIVVSGNLGD